MDWHHHWRFGRSIFSPAAEWRQYADRSVSFMDSDVDEDAFSMLPRGRSSNQTGFVPMLPQELVIDDEGAVIVFVFPRERDLNGTVDPDRRVRNPWRKASKIFTNEGMYALPKDAFPEGESVSARQYQEVIRENILKALVSSGLKPTSFESVDKDETFLRISVDPDGQVLPQLARNYLYRMPLNDEAYNCIGPVGTYPGYTPMVDWFGKPTYAYHEYDPSQHAKFQPFRDVDTIRLVKRRMDDLMDFEELRRQNIISRYFPAAHHHAVLDLHESWASLRKILCIPFKVDDDRIRDYFGEKTAFVFRYFTFYIHMLIPLVILAIFVSPGELDLFHLSYQTQNAIKIAFGFIVVIWSTCFKKLYEYHAVRLRQRWGMQDYDTNAVCAKLPDYRPELEGTNRWIGQIMFGYVVILIFCSIVAYCHFLVVQSRSEHMELMMTMLVQGSSLLWGYIAAWLVDLQNHRTQDRYDNALIKKLAIVKLFLYIWPFLRYAFLMNWELRTCATSLDEVAKKVFRSRDWPSGVAAELYHQWLPEYTFAAGNLTCMYGCVPFKCHLDTWPNGTAMGSASCLTECYYTLQSALRLLYFTHAGTTMLFVFIPIIRTCIAARYEMFRARQQKEEQFCADVSPDASYSSLSQSSCRSNWAYSFLQFQAKCHSQAEYRYLQWGGSYVEDLLEVIVGFALLTCFGIIHPPLIIFGFVAQVVEYRLLAYRMTNVTCRPFPVGSEGIGMWSRVIDVVGVLACLTNAALAVFVMRPMTRMQWKHKVIGFFVIQNILLMARFLIPVLIPDQASDVMRIGDFNAEVIRKVLQRPVLDVPPEEKYGSDDVDIGLRPSRLDD